MSKRGVDYSRAREGSFWVPKCAKLELMASAMPLLKPFAILSLAERPLMNQNTPRAKTAAHTNS